jgi:hypothetical protein
VPSPGQSSQSCSKLAPILGMVSLGDLTATNLSALYAYSSDRSSVFRFQPNLYLLVAVAETQQQTAVPLDESCASAARNYKSPREVLGVKIIMHIPHRPAVSQ